MSVQVTFRTLDYGFVLLLGSLVAGAWTVAERLIDAVTDNERQVSAAEERVREQFNAEVDRRIASDIELRREIEELRKILFLVCRTDSSVAAAADDDKNKQ